jgi:hypothetical protein
MKEYQLKSEPNLRVKLPDSIYTETLKLNFRLSGRDKPGNLEYNGLGAIADLYSLGLDGGAFTWTNGMIGYSDVGQDIIWLAIARAISVQGKNRAGVSLDTATLETANELEKLISHIKPLAAKIYDDRRGPLRKGKPVNLHIDISR